MGRPTTLAVVVVLGVTSMLGWWLGRHPGTVRSQVRVTEVLDGDTIVVAFPDGHTDTVRILGVDTSTP